MTVLIERAGLDLASRNLMKNKNILQIVSIKEVDNNNNFNNPADKEQGVASQASSSKMINYSKYQYDDKIQIDDDNDDSTLSEDD